jgi:dolichol-phosphate mannosyltransferase
MDGDYTYSAKDIERFLPFRKEFDQIFGFRMGTENINRLHRLGNWVINTTLNVLFGASLSDVCTGMYMLKTEVARNLELRSRGFDVEVEAAIKNITNGKVTEVPISYRSRLGTRKLSTWRHGISILGSVLGLSLSHNPIFLLSSLSSLFTIPGSLILLREFYQRLMYGNAGWSIEYVWLGLILFIIGLNSFTIAIFDLISKKQERRIVRHIKDLTR